jgi:cAMP-dependent protein kinase regulator
MVLSWLGGGKEETVADLLAKRSFAKAVEVARAELKARPGNPRLRLQLADVLIRVGQAGEAVGILRELADELAQEGFVAKSIAILKKVKRIDPTLPGVEEKLASMVVEQRNTVTIRPVPAAELCIDVSAFEHRPIDAGTSTPADRAEPGPAAAAPEASPTGPTPGFHTPLFQDFSKDELVAVIRGLELKSFEPGDIIVAEGEPGDSLFVLTTGSVKAFVKDPVGRYGRVRELGEGDFFGEISILTGKPRTATITAASDCDLLELDRAALDSITRTHPRVRDVLRRFYQERAGSSVEAGVRGTGGPA